MSKELADLMIIITACACLDAEFISSNECVKKFETIKNALEEKEANEKKLKAFDIINKKEVNMYMLKWYFKYSNYEQYTKDFSRNDLDCDLPDLSAKLLTEEEFDLLKEAME